MLLAQEVPDGRVFALDTQTLISIGIQLLNGIILAVALTFILYRPVKEFMNKRTERFQSKVKEAEAAMARANELMAEYNSKLEAIERDRDKILEEARLKAADESRIILEEARREAYEIKKRSLESVEEDKRRLKEETRSYVVDLASRIAQKYIAERMDAETQDRLFEEVVARLEDAKWQN